MADLPLVPPLLSSSNLLGSPVTSGLGIAASLAMQLSKNGISLPTDVGGWITLVLAIITAILGLLLRQPGKV